MINDYLWVIYSHNYVFQRNNTHFNLVFIILTLAIFNLQF